MKPMKYRSDTYAAYTGPIDKTDGTAITSATSAKLRVFHDRKDSRLTADVSSGTTLNVSTTRPYTVGDSVVVRLDTGAWHEAGDITSIDNAAKTITITTAIPSLASKDNNVAVVLGDAIGGTTPWEIDMSYYEPASGAVAGNHDYGWRGVIPDTQSRIDIGMAVRIELDMNFGTDMQVLEVIRTFVEGGT